MINNIRRFDLSIGAIPSTYSESLSYLEKLEIIIRKINEIISKVNELSFDNFEKLVDEKIKELKYYVDLQDEMLYNDIEKKYTDCLNYTNHQITLLDNSLKNLINEKVLFLIGYIKNSNNSLKFELLQELESIKKEIDNIIIKGINIYNPCTGKKENVQKVVLDLYNFLRYYGITALEFDGLGLSCQEFDNKNITARNFDLYSKNIFIIDFSKFMYSPFTGKITSIPDIINDLADFHKTSISANEFDLLELTSSIFDEKNLTAYQFDWHGKTLLEN